MAKANMGSIVTNLAGKMGGHCFRVMRGTQVFQNNPKQTLVNRKKSSSRSQNTRYIMGLWSKLSADEVKQWYDNSLLLQFADRWGNMRTLDKKSFFVKMQLQLLASKQSVVAGNDFVAVMPDFYCSEVQCNITNADIKLIDWNLIEGSITSLNIIQLSNAAQTPVVSSIYPTVHFVTNAFDGGLLYQQVFDATGGGFNTTDIIYFAMRNTSSSGMVSPWFYYKVIFS